MKVVDIADEIFKDLGEPANITVASISSSIRSKVGELNNLICESFSVNGSTLEILDTDSVEINIHAAAVLKKIYCIGYYSREYRSNLTTMSSDLLLEVRDGGKSVKRMNRNEVGKTILSMKSQEESSLKTLINAYKMKDMTPRQVSGDDNLAYDVLSRPLDGSGVRRRRY